MTNDQQLLVTNWQAFAALLMGIEYFLPKAIKDGADEQIRSYLKSVEGRVDVDLLNALREVLREKTVLIVGASFIGLFYLSMESAKHLRGTLFLPLIGIAGVLFFCLGFLAILQTLFPRVLLFFYGLPVRLMVTFIRICPRGPIAACGFFCLIVSFCLRYLYLK